MPFDFSENVNVLFERLEKFFTSKTVIGETIQVGDVTLIPLVSLSFGLGSGGGGEMKNEQSEGGGGGIGAKASPTAVIIVKGGEVQIMSIGTPGGLEKFIEMVPEVLSKVMNKEKETEEASEKE